MKHSFLYTEEPGKGLDLLLRIFPLVKNKFPDALLYISFDGAQTSMTVVPEYVRFGKYDADIWIYTGDTAGKSIRTNASMSQKAGSLCIATNIHPLDEVINSRGVLIGYAHGSNEYICAILLTIDILFKSDLYANKVKRALEWGKNLMPVHVVNLDRQPEKWALCKEKLLKAGIATYERFQAVDGEKLEWGEELERYFKLKDDNYYYIKHDGNVGIFGCAMSHIRLWEKFETDTANDVWMVMEDDIVFSDYFSKSWNDTYESIKKDSSWDLCYPGFLFFEEPIKSTDIKLSDNLYRLMKSDERRNVGGTHCYCIRRSGVKKLLEIIRRDKVSRPIDWIPIDNFDTIISYLMYPTICDQDRRIPSSVQGRQKTLKGLDYCTVDYQGGLGNQLFQIMMILSYSIKTGKPYIFQYADTCKCNTRHTYWNTLFKNIRHHCVDDLSSRMKNISYIKETKFNEYAPIPYLKGNVSFYGFFQSYRYFDDVKEACYKILGIDNIVCNDDILNVPVDTKLVSVHFRLGDYKTNKFHPIQPVEYYQEALGHVIKPGQKYKILYFCEAEDNEMVLSEYISKLEHKDLFVKVPDSMSDIEQLFVMTQCDIAVIANSSFSWWGAYLGKKKEQVKYPTVWTLDSNVTDDMIPEYWLLPDSV